MQIPYGRSNFEEIRRRGYFYVDKTPFLPVLERAEIGYPLFLRPRRFGKSTLLSMLEHYYDLDRKELFDDLFEGLWIHERPTTERNGYLVLSLDFSRLTAEDDPGSLRQGFNEAVKGSLRTFFMRYRDRIPELATMYDEIGHYRDAASLMTNVLGIVAGTGYKVYVLIDEYDNFANQLLSRGSEELYTEAVLEKTGFVRGFYATLKAGTGSGAVERLFITGVTPLVLDDLSSGFNIANNISMSAHFNRLAGFTHADVDRALAEFLAERPELSDRIHPETLGDVLEAYYDGYRFSPDAPERVFNSDMVLYFLRELADRGRYPDDMLDLNVRTSYRHLQLIGAPGSAAATERRALLETILREGHVRSNLVRQFGVKSLSTQASYLSLLYYMGMLTLRGTPRDAEGYDLEIPNQVIRELQWEHLAVMLSEQGGVKVDTKDLESALAAMAMRGDIAPFLDLFQQKVLKALGLKDLRRLDEKTIKLLFTMYASLGRVFVPLSEKEFAQGYCDLFLGTAANLPGVRFSWLLEFKYLKVNATPAQIEAAFAEAEAQVARYAGDAALLPLLVGDRELKAGMIVFVGTRKALFRPWPSDDPRAKPSKKTVARKKAPPRARPGRRG